MSGGRSAGRSAGRSRRVRRATPRVAAGLLALMVGVWLAVIGVGEVSAEGRCWLPIAPSGSGIGGPIPTAPSPPPDGWSDVLAYVPRYPDSDLAFYATHLAEPEPAVEALYDVGAASPGDVARWYWDHLPEQGWMLAEDGPDYRRWTRGQGWLTVQPGYEASGSRWLRLTRDPAGARARSAYALDGLIRLPPGAARWRYDRSDLLPEEWRLPADLATASELTAAMLLSDGWIAEGSTSVGEARVTTYGLDRQRLAVAVWEPSRGVSEIAVGERDCLPVDVVDGPDSWRELSVYLEAVPAPPATRIVRFEHRTDDSRAIEEWLGDCMDIDVFAAVLGQRLDEAEWTGPPGASARVPGGAHRTAVSPDGGDGVTYAARAQEGGRLRIEVSRQARGRRVPEGSSLLFPDLPLPPDASAEQMRTDTAEGWHHRETYSIRTVDDPESYYMGAMPARGWAHERGHDGSADPWHVFYAGGEEVRLDVGAQGASVTLARRRVCESHEPIPPDDVGLPSRHMLEMPVYPGATELAFADGEETYYVSCAGLDLIADWYRVALEDGDWALAGTVGPEDPFHRELLFVRPEERPLPPEERTAWAEVVIDRDWPYQYTLRLSRDPGGVRPATPAQ